MVKILRYLAIAFLSLGQISTVYAEDDPFPNVASGAEIGPRQAVSPSTGNPLDGSPIISCPSGAGLAGVADFLIGNYVVCVKTWRPTVDLNADKDFQDRIKAATEAAEAESKAWNAANPGKQKCIQWGPIVHANGVSTSSGGVCANPVEPGSGTTVPSQETTSVTGPEQQANQSSSNNQISSSSSNVSEPNSFARGSGSGYPFTVILEGQKSASECPAGYQAGTGIIVQIGTGTFTECWPERALVAWRLGGIHWQNFKDSGGSYNVQSVIDKLAVIADYKSQAKALAQKAANETPGVQRCSNWSVYGESGQECAYAFVNPSDSNGNSTDENTQNPITVFDSNTAISSDTSTVLSNPILVTQGTKGSIKAPSQLANSSDSQTAQVGIAATQFSGTIKEVEAIAKKVEKIVSIQNAILSSVDKLQKIQGKTYTSKIKLPDLKTITEIAESLTPDVCSVSGLNVIQIQKGKCVVSYSVTSPSGNSYTAEKVIEFRRKI